MAKNAITVMQEGNKALDEINGKLNQTIQNVLAINDAALKVGKNFFNVKSPKEVNSSLEKNKNIQIQLSALTQERVKLEKALISQVNKQKLAEEGRAKALVKSRYEVQQLNQKAKEAAILSSRLATEYQKQSVKLIQLRRQYKDVALVQGESSKAAQTLLTKITALDTRLKRVDGNVGQFQRSVGNYGKAMQSAVAAARNLAGALGFTSGIILAVNVMKDAVDTIKTFNSGILNVSKTTGIVGEDLDSLSDSIVKLSMNLSTVGTKSLLQYATVAGQLGVKGTENILAYTESLAKLETASDITGEEGGASIARLLTLTDGGVENVKEFGDEIVKLGNNFAATESEILSNATAIAQNTGIYKLGRQEVLSYAVATKAVGIESEITGSTIGKTLGILEKSIRTQQGLEQISRLTGIAQNDLGKAFDENSGQVFQRLIKGLNEIDKAGGSVNQQLEELGIKSVRNQRVIGTLATAGYDTLEKSISDVTSAFGSLDQEFETASSKIENQLGRIGIAFDNLILSAEDGKGVLGDFVKFISDRYVTNFEKLNVVLNENISITDRWKVSANAVWSSITFGAFKPFEEYTQKLVDNSKAIEGNEANTSKLSQAYVDIFGNIIPVINEQQKLNEETEFYFGMLSKNTEKESDSIAGLKDKIKVLKDEQEQLTANDKELYKEKQKLIDNYQKEIDAIKGVSNVRKQGIQAITGSIAFLESEIKILEEKRSKLTTNSTAYKQYTDAIDDANSSLIRLKDTLTGVYTELADAGLGEGVDLFKIDQDVIDRAEKFKKEQDKKSEIFGVEGLDDDEYQAFLDKEDKKQEKLRETAEYEKQLREETRDNAVAAFSESVNFVNALFDAKVQKYDDEINKNNDYYAALLDNEMLSEEQRSALEAERDRKNLELEKKKRQEQKKAAILNKVAGIAEVAINTAIAVSKVTAQTGIAAPLLIPSIIALGALQAATIAAQPIPQYKDGKRQGEGKDGIALLNDGGKDELRISKSGEIERIKGRNVLAPVLKSDTIVPDADKFLSNLSDKELYENLHKHTILASISHQKQTIDNYLIAQSMEKAYEKQTNRMIKAIEKNRPKINLHNNNNIGDDLKFLAKLNSL